MAGELALNCLWLPEPAACSLDQALSSAMLDTFTASDLEPYDADSATGAGSTHALPEKKSEVLCVRVPGPCSTFTLLVLPLPQRS